VDLTLTRDQSALADAVNALLARRAGPERLRALHGAYDHDLEDALAHAGFLDLFRSPDAGPLEAALVVEAVSRAAGVAAVGARALVAPALAEEPLTPPVALSAEEDPGPVRFGAQARTLLVAGAEDASVVALAPGDATPVRSSYGYPMAALTPGPGRSLGPGSGARMRAWWRVALAVEAVGAMRAALDLTVGYVSERRQFGRPVGSFQALQHRLAEAAVLVEGSRWLALEAAWRGAPDEAAATAATHATLAAHRICTETHQMTGAIGLTTEYDLHVWTMRLEALRLELAGAAGHARALASARWGFARA
jgi:alkylation response protein AidB-like acyl-CoA dehydrogenase